VHRREFIFGLSAMALSPRLSASSVGVDGARLNRRLRELAPFGRTPEGGISRVAFSEADREARKLAVSWMREAGLDVRTDAAATSSEGARPRPSPSSLRLHVDSSLKGELRRTGRLGRAIEVVQCLKDRGLETLHPLEVVIFAN
jgi:hypothetical protein